MACNEGPSAPPAFEDLNDELFTMEPHALVRQQLIDDAPGPSAPFEASAPAFDPGDSPDMKRDLPQMKPFTEGHLISLCDDQSLREKSKEFEDRFLLECKQQAELELVLDFDIDTGTDDSCHNDQSPRKRNDTFQQLLADYLTARKGLSEAREAIRIRHEEAGDYEKNIWTFVERKSEKKGKCHDGNEVDSSMSYEVANFSESAVASFRQAHKDVKTMLTEQLSIHSFRSSSVKLNLEQRLISLLKETQRKDILIRAISILFTFQRQRIEDEEFVANSRYWLEQCVVSLFQRPDCTFDDRLFVLHHVLRCGPGFGRWAACLIQIKPPAEEDYYDLSNSPKGCHDVFDHPALHELHVVLSILTSPIRGRESFIKELLTPSTSVSNGDSWVVVDSEGEEDANSSTSHMKENDLVAILNQVPFSNFFRFLLKFDTIDGKLVMRKTFSEPGFIKLLAYCTKLISTLREGC